MKLIIAIIRENQLDQVREALIEAGITRITVSNVAGHGRSKTEEIYRGQIVVPNLIPNARLEIAVNDEFVDTTCQCHHQCNKGECRRPGWKWENFCNTA